MTKKTILKDLLTLVAGVTIGVIISNPEKVKEKVEMVYNKCTKHEETTNSDDNEEFQEEEYYDDDPDDEPVQYFEETRGEFSI